MVGLYIQINWIDKLLYKNNIWYNLYLSRVKQVVGTVIDAEYYFVCSTIEVALTFAFCVYIQIEDDEFRHI